LNENNSLEESWFSQNSVLEPEINHMQIPVISGHRPQKIVSVRQPAVRRVIRRENKCIQALSLPVFLVYNMRSIWAKQNNFAEDMQERAADISFLSEVWEKSENRKHQAKIEEMLEMNNISYISTPRPGAKRGGGAGIAINPSRFSVSKLNIAIPKPLEIVWALLRPIESTGEIRKIILCSLYSPPNSKKNNLLIDHISLTYNALKIQHPEARTMICGDRNNLDEKKIIALDPNFHQSLSQNTRKDKRLYMIITDLQSYYHVPIVIPPVPVDVPGQGVPSDHCGVLTVPITNINSQRKSESRKVKVRPLPDSLISKFGSILVNEDWAFLCPQLPSTELVETFEHYTSTLIGQTFPEKTVTISSRDKPFMTEELKLLRRQRQRHTGRVVQMQSTWTLLTSLNRK
jgi:hypothetical protein